ncbi:transcription factor TFIIIB subunit brf1 [Teratosphaeriaceae sp. CCFEE 6253]|nr:transcription factor TFIIIB subunit brf1 [Teratosphaeriaceae sp. CCFEE 6253]
MSAPVAAPRRRLGTLAPPAPGRPKPRPKAPVRPACCEEPNIVSEDGSRVCANCGTQIEEANIVADVTFEEDARGAATVQGGYIGDSARHARTLGNGARRIGGGERNTAQETENNARRALNALCPRLGIAQRVADQAQSLFVLAARCSFNSGRRNDEVIGACLFAACRRQRDNAILLMDIAEVQKINVFRLGEVYKALCDKLYFHEDDQMGLQHVVDIEPLIQRYCRKLEFGPKTRDVATDAVRILKRMKRDWIVTGRHPAGLCGACIILAARMNNFRRTVREVVFVAKVADVTIASRVEEFRRTRASNLTVEQFREYGTRFRDDQLPPVMTTSEIRREKFEAKKRQRTEQGILRATAERETMERTGADGWPIEISDDEDGDSSLSPSQTPDPEHADAQPRRKRPRLQEPSATPQHEPRFDADGFAIPSLPHIDPALDGGVPEPAVPPKRKRGRPKKSDKPEPIVITSAELDAEDRLADEIDEALHDEMLMKLKDEAWLAKQEEEAAGALAVVQPIADQARSAQSGQETERRETEGVDWRPEPDPPVTANPELATAEELEAEFADDPEVANCLLNEHEQKTKELIWVHHNIDWLRSQQEKILLKKMAEHANQGKEKPKRKPGRKKKEGRMGDRSVLENAETPIETPADAAGAMLRKNAPAAFSRFVDYEMLAKVYNKRGSATPTEGTEASQSRAGSVAASSVQGDGEARTPARRAVAGGLQSPQATQGLAGRGGESPTPVPAPARDASAHPMSPPETQQQQPALDDEALHDNDDYRDEDAYPGAAIDNDHEEEGEYAHSETSQRAGTRGGWGDNDEDEREDVGEEGGAAEEEAEYRRGIREGEYGTFGGEEEEWA